MNKDPSQMGETRLLASNSREDDGYCLQNKAGNVCLRAKPLIAELCHTADSPFFTPYFSANPYRSLSTNPSLQFLYPTPYSTPTMACRAIAGAFCQFPVPCPYPVMHRAFLPLLTELLSTPASTGSVPQGRRGKQHPEAGP